MDALFAQFQKLPIDKSLILSSPGGRLEFSWLLLDWISRSTPSPSDSEGCILYAVCLSMAKWSCRQPGDPVRTAVSC